MRFIRCLIVVSVIALATTTPTTSTTAQTAPDSTPVPKVALIPPVAQITKQPLTELVSVEEPAPVPAPAPAATYTGYISDHNALMAQAGISASDFGYAAELIAMEDQSWDVHATNPTSGAYGIPQSLPAGKMASAGADWRDNPVTQLRWMQTYVKGSYGTWAAAVSFHVSHNWY